ncbi:MAG: C25 family cysteine peptidase [Candidatus Cloacimonadales bacterium]|nr:C25 family cysteine peptidase [Candidatus Cloacimonadales bacterium]
MKRLLLVLLLMPFVLNALLINIEEPVVINNRFANKLPGTYDIGKPELPYVPIKVLLPMGEELKNISVNLLNENTRQVNYIDYVRQPQPISQAHPDQTPRDEAVYQTDSFYPEMNYEILGTQTYRGYNLLLINLYPYKYNPVTKELIWFEKAEIDFSTRFENSLMVAQNNKLILNSKTENVLRRIAVNTDAISSYHKQSVSSLRTLVSPNDPYSMIIITDEERLPFFADFLQWKIDHSISTAIFLTSDIYAEYTGVNNQEKIKNFINDAYTTYSGTTTPLEFVTLGGDDEIIPIRTVYINTGGTIDENMPCDAYYSCLDNNWDGNGNGIYGEIQDNVDLVPEIAVGRITAETEAEFNRFFNKTYHYVDEVSVSDDMVYALGENLNNDPLTWGGDYMDEVLDEVPNMEDDYHVFKLYDREGTFSTQSVKDAINNGVAIIDHMGHSNETMVFGQNISHTTTYTNTEYGFAYTQGCYPAAFDEMTSHAGESVGENMVIAEGGLYAFVGNTRYGWYSPGSTNGPSQPYDIEFFRAIFTENIRALGSALSESRIVLANEALSNTYLRWVHYELVLFGDPSVEVKYANGSFPFLVPANVVYDDSSTGDGDGIPNPGEEIEIFIEIENMEGWADATDVTATIEFEDPTIELITGSVNYGVITNGTTSSSDPFLVQVPQDCNYDSYFYTLTISAPVSGGSFFQKSFELSFDVSLFQQNWPWITNCSVLSNPIIADFDQNGSKNVLIVDAEANVNLLNANANLVNGYPWTNEENIWKSTALANINETESEELVIASRTGRIFAYDNSGTEVFSTQTSADQLLTPMIADIDGDGQMDIVSFGIDKNLNVLNADGAFLTNFPVELPMLSFFDMAAADLDENGTTEILIGTLAGNLHAINSDGTDISGFPVVLTSQTYSAPIVLDNLKIVIGTFDNKLYIIAPDGTILLQKDIDGRVAVSPIAADFDNDDELEIAFATLNGHLHIVEQDGTELAGWPVDLGHSVTNPPITADIDNDNDIELMCFTSINDLYVFNPDGSEVEFAPVPVCLIGNTPASIEDIDLDGDYDIISGISTGAFVIDVKLPKGLKTPWKTYRGNYRRTGFYGDNELFTQAGEVIPPIGTSRLNQNYPNPFNPVTTISFALADAAKVDLEVFNIKGQKVRTLLASDSFEKGVMQVVWDGRDNLGKSVSSGVYFYKLRVNDKNIDTKKCLLLK